MSVERRALGCEIELSPDRTPATQNVPTTFAEGGNKVTLPAGLRMRADIQNAGGLADGTLDLTIWGMTRSIMNQLATLGLQINLLQTNRVTLTAGVAGKMSTAFIGFITAAEADFNAMPEPSFRITAHTLGAWAARPARRRASPGPCCPPSTSITSRKRWLAKSAIAQPSGTWRRNRAEAKSRRRIDHNAVSAAVGSRRIARALVTLSGGGWRFMVTGGWIIYFIPMR